jgi:hypothetical protein
MTFFVSKSGSTKQGIVWNLTKDGMRTRGCSCSMFRAARHSPVGSHGFHKEQTPAVSFLECDNCTFNTLND